MTAGVIVVDMTDSSTDTSTDTIGNPDLTTVTATIDAHLAAYCEPDPEKRAGPLADAWTHDGRLVDPPMEATGPEGVSGLADVVVQHYPGHTFRRTSAVDLHHEFARYAWALVAPDGTHSVTGLDVVRVAPDGRIAGIVGFFGDLPAA